MSNELFPKLSVLLAMSNGQAMEAFKPILRTHGVGKAVAVENNYDALSVLKEMNFNMIVIDDRFPELGGFDFCRFIRLTNISASVVPIIFGLHEPSQQSVMKARDVGASKIVAMPLTGQGLIKAVTATLNEMKPIVQHSSYNGPDRRRPNAPAWNKPERRSEQPNQITVAQQRKAMFGVKG